MKNKIWLFQLPIIALFTFAFWVTEAGVQGELENSMLRERFFPAFRRLSVPFTDWKFRIRGAQKPKSKIVIVEIDDASIKQFGRWPWHRDVMMDLIHFTYAAGAKVVGLDIVFSEPDQRVPDELAQFLKEKKLESNISAFETDRYLERVIADESDRLILGWLSDMDCQPALSSSDKCPVNEPTLLEQFPEGFDKFSYDTFTMSGKPVTNFDKNKTPMITFLKVTPNLPAYNKLGKYAGAFTVNTDSDGVIRRTSLAYMYNGKPYPTLPLVMSKVGLNDKLRIDLNDRYRVNTIGYEKSGYNIPVSPLGIMEINFRGPGMTFPYVSALDVVSPEEEITVSSGFNFIKSSKKEVFKDAYVLIGLSAMGVFDMRTFPFSDNVPGVEGHANILDNLLSQDPLRPMPGGTLWMSLLLSVGALLFALIIDRLESVPGLLVSMASLGAFWAFDQKFLFEKQSINWNSGFLYMEYLLVFMSAVAIKYVMEEKNKKFIRGAFSKYVAPAIVDSILKDPAKLTVGGEKRELTIMFSDIRGFTTFSEKMDPKALAKFLNDYLGIMTNLVFDHNGTLDKYIGDAVMAFWGAPVDQPEHAYNALQGARAMLHALAENHERFKTQYGVDVKIGVGINSGPVNVGNMGSERIFEYTVIGDNVNLASRLEGLTKAYGVTILTTRATIDYAEKAGKPLPPYRTLDDVKVKGKKKAVELIQILDGEASSYSQEGLRLFVEARELYRKQQWNQAIEKFSAANTLLQRDGIADGPSEMFIGRCEEFKQNPPSADWDGSWEMHSK